MKKAPIRLQSLQRTWKGSLDIKKVQTDNRKEFTNSESDKKTLFEVKLEEKGIEYVTTRPYSPQENGKVERSHRLDSKYYADKKFKSKEELLRAIRKYNTRYNNISRRVLGFKSPNEVLKEYKENQQVKDTLGKKCFF